MTSAGGGAVSGGPRLGRRATLAGGLAGLGVSVAACTRDSEAPPGPVPSPGPGPPENRFTGDPGPGRMYFGVSLATDQPAVDETGLGAAGISLARRFYPPHQIGLMSAMVASDARSGVVPFVSFKVDGSWASVATGRQDRWLDRLLEPLDGLGVPSMIGLHHEPENDVSAGGDDAASWVAMQQRLLRRTESLPTVTPVPILMNWTFQSRQRKPAEWLVPESPVMGIDFYNPWRPDTGGQWEEFATLYERCRDYIPEQTIVVPEMGTAADPFDPTRAALWLRDAFDTAVREGIAGMAWFDARLKAGRGRVLDPAGRRELIHLLGRPEVARVEPSSV